MANIHLSDRGLVDGECPDILQAGVNSRNLSRKWKSYLPFTKVEVISFITKWKSYLPLPFTFGISNSAIIWSAYLKSAKLEDCVFDLLVSGENPSSFWLLWTSTSLLDLHLGGLQQQLQQQQQQQQAHPCHLHNDNNNNNNKLIHDTCTIGNLSSRQLLEGCLYCDKLHWYGLPHSCYGGDGGCQLRYDWSFGEGDLGLKHLMCSSILSDVTFACAMLSAREVILTEVRLVSIMLMNSWIKMRKSASLISVPVVPDAPSMALVISVVTSTTACDNSQMCLLHFFV